MGVKVHLRKRAFAFQSNYIVQFYMDVSIDRHAETPVTLAVPQAGANMKKPGDDIFLRIEKPETVPPPRPPSAPRPPPPAPRPPPPPVQQQQPAMQSNDLRQTLEEFANPRKLGPVNLGNERPPSDISGGGGGGDDDEYEDDDEDEDDEDDDGGAGYSVDEPLDDPAEEPLKPSEGFKTFDEEKAHLIFKLARAKRAGMPSSRTFTMASDIRDMRAEMARIDHELALDASLKFQRKILMASVSTIEFLNTRYDPFELRLSGWSESMMDSMGDYDTVFERLHDKYKSKVKMAPELELLMMVAGSAMMFHFTQTMFKQSLPGMTNNPELMQSMMNAVMQAQKPQAPPPPPPSSKPAPPVPPQQQQQQQQEQQQQTTGRREMRGPGMDLGGIMSMAGGGALPFPPMGPPKPSTKRAAEMPLPEVDDEDDDDRVSDIVSDEDLESVPEDLSSFGDGEDPDIRTVAVKTVPKGRGGGAGRGKKSKTIITI